VKLVVAAVSAVFFLLPFSEALPKWASAAWIGAVVTLILGCLIFGQGRRPAWHWVWVVAAYLAAIGVVSSAANADSMRGHLLIGAQVLIFIAAGPFALRRMVSVDGLTARAVSAFLAGQTISAAAGIAQAAGVTTLGFRAVNGRAYGLASHPNILGLLSGVAVVIFLYLIFKTARRKVPLLLGLALNIGALVFSGSVSSYIACLLGVAVFMRAARLSFRVPLLLGVAGVGAMWALDQLDKAGIMRNPARRLAQVTGQTRDASTLDIRQGTYAYAWEGIQRDPFFGRGLDPASGATFDHVTLTHNVLLRTWFQGGLGMGLAFALIVAAIVVTVVRAVVRRQDATSAGVLAVLISFSMTSAALQQGYFWLLLLGAWVLLSNPAGVTGSGFLDVERGARAAVAAQTH
jgi:hypothetical protein